MRDVVENPTRVIVSAGIHSTLINRALRGGKASQASNESFFIRPLERLFRVNTQKERDSLQIGRVAECKRGARGREREKPRRRNFSYVRRGIGDELIRTPDALLFARSASRGVIRVTAIKLELRFDLPTAARRSLLIAVDTDCI